MASNLLSVASHLAMALPREIQVTKRGRPGNKTVQVRTSTAERAERAPKAKCAGRAATDARPLGPATEQLEARYRKGTEDWGEVYSERAFKESCRCWGCLNMSAWKQHGKLFAHGIVLHFVQVSTKNVRPKTGLLKLLFMRAGCS